MVTDIFSNVAEHPVVAAFLGLFITMLCFMACSTLEAVVRVFGSKR